MSCLDPTLDVVFKLLFVREPVLLHDMLSGILGRPIRDTEITDPTVPGELVSDRRVIFDLRVRLDDGSRVDLEMQRKILSTLTSRLVYYVARDYADQLGWGDGYHLLSPSIGVVWLAAVLPGAPKRLHSIFELRERHEDAKFSDQLAIHLLQLPHRGGERREGYAATIHRWARFFTADDAELERLALESPVMNLAKRALERLSEDPQVRRLAREREDAIKFHRMELAVNRAEGVAQGRAEGVAQGRAEVLLRLLGLRFGSVPQAVRARVVDASAGQVDAWIDRVLSATTLEELLAP